jgi:NAD(P)-dependent dehydrogenase (short-subunit alcohol dehydrogenase family)
MNFDGKVAIITGSAEKEPAMPSRGDLPRKGWVVSDINDAGGDETVALIEADRGRAAFHPADVKNENEINGLIAFAESTFGGLDILVNNASKPDTMGLLIGWMDAMAVEILAPMRSTLTTIEAMRRC